MHSTERSSWVTHDFKVKMLEWSAFRGSHLAHTCRRCGRACRLFTLLRQGTWAVDGEGCARARRRGDRSMAIGTLSAPPQRYGSRRPQTTAGFPQRLMTALCQQTWQ